MTETTDWDALRMLRMQGHKPALSVIVTTKSQLPRRLEGVGCMVILHKAGEPMPIKLLDGLDVIFFFDRCDLAFHVEQLAKSKGVKFGRAQSWCHCGSHLSTVLVSCESHAAMVDWFEKPHAAA